MYFILLECQFYYRSLKLGDIIFSFDRGDHKLNTVTGYRSNTYLTSGLKKQNINTANDILNYF